MSLVNLQFLAFGRISDSCILALHSEWGGKQEHVAIETFVKLMGAAQAKMNPGQRQRLQWNDNSICILMDHTQKYLCGLIATSKSYPDKYAFQLVTQFMEEVLEKSEALVDVVQAYGLSLEYKDRMKELLSEYDDPNKFDSLYKVKNKVDTTKIAMGDSVRRVLENTEDLESLEQKSATTVESAAVFGRTTRHYRDQQWWRNCKTIGIVSVIVVITILLIVWHFLAKK
eukprot:Platyproteum_vivax@DN1360_c0_g1_i1.p1